MRLVSFFIFLSLAVGSYADKPEWTGKGKPSEEQKAVHRATMEAKADDVENGLKKEREKAGKKLDKEDSGKEGRDAAMAKQREKKSEQERKSADKGSEKGQAQRQEKSRAWWKFWED